MAEKGYKFTNELGFATIDQNAIQIDSIMTAKKNWKWLGSNDKNYDEPR